MSRPTWPEARSFPASVWLALVMTCIAATVDRVSRAEDAAAEKLGADGDWFRPEADARSLRRVLDEGHVSKRWIYHDLDAARRRARDSGKPLLVVFRCVPCGSAPGLDGAVCSAGGAEASEFEKRIRKAGGKLEALLDQFVTVRMVKMNGVNRKVFQFDRDVPYVAMFLNADGVVYGRYGTRASSDRKNLPRHRLTSFQKSLERALELHGDYPRNKARLAANRVAMRGAAMVEDMKTFEPFPAKYNPKGVENCVHCHTVGEAETRQKLIAGPLALSDVFPFPLPGNVGLKIAVDDGLEVESVSAGSAAERAGIRAGDVLVDLAGQPLTSEADIQWALHHAPDRGTVPVVVRRGDQNVAVALVLAGNWRRGDGHWRSAIAPLRPNLHLRPDPYRVKKGAKPGEMGLTVHYPRGAAAKAGLRGGDLLVAVDGRTDLHLEADFLHYLHIEKPRVKTVELTIIRKGVRSTLRLPIR